MSKWTKNNFYHFNIYFKKLRNLREIFKKYSIKILKLIK